MLPSQTQLPADDVRTMPPPRARQSIAMYRRIATFFLVMTALVVALVAYVVLSRATVVILSKPESVNADFILDVAAKPTAGEVPGQVLQSEASLTGTYPTSAAAKTDVVAEGTVRIVSTLYRDQTLVATTRLLTSGGVLFRLRKTVVVPGNGSIAAEVYADQPGASGAVGSTAFTIPGLNPDTGRFFTVTTVGDISGGEREGHVLTKADVDAAAADLEAKLKGQLGETVRRKARDAGVGLGGEIVAFEVVRKTTDVPIGDARDSFALTLGLKASAVFYDAAEFDRQLRANMSERLPFGRALVSVERGSIATEVEKVDLVAGRANLHVTAKGASGLSKDSPAMQKSKLLGISAEGAKKYLEDIDGVSSASVTVRPFWIGRLPNVPEHITIEVR